MKVLNPRGLKGVITPFSRTVKTMAVLFLIISFTACVKEVSIEHSDPLEATAELRVDTRIDAIETNPSLPIRIYAINSSNKCVAAQTIMTAGENFSLALPAGTFTVYALAGATDEMYNLPADKDVTPSTIVALKENTGLHADIQTGNASVTLERGKTESITIVVKRIITGITAEITDIPEDITAVSVSLTPLYAEALLDGTYGTMADASVTIPLTKGTNGSWSTATEIFTMPSSNNVSITIALTGADGTNEFSYNSEELMEANQKTSIHAAYKEGSPEVGGIITGEDWNGTVNISFAFGKGAGKDNDGEINIPSVGTIYQGCYVLAVNGNAVTLLSDIETTLTGTATTPIAGLIDHWITILNAAETIAWRLPNLTEAIAIQSTFEIISTAFTKASRTPLKIDGRYVYLDTDIKQRIFTQSNAPNSGSSSISNGIEYTIRPIRSIFLEIP